MGKLFILIRRKGSTRFIGAIPVKKGVSSARIKILLRKQPKLGLISRVVSETQLRRVIIATSPRVRRVRTRKRIQRRVRRKIRRRIKRKR